MMPTLKPRHKRRLKLVLVVLTACAAAWIVAWASGRAIELRSRLTCASNIKNLGTALKIYGSADRGSMDASVDWAITNGLIDAGSTICPASGLSKSNYVWVRPLDRASIESNAVIMYEPKSNHGGEGGSVLFADGHAEFVLGADYDRLIESVHKTGP